MVPSFGGAIGPFRLIEWGGTATSWLLLSKLRSDTINGTS